MSDTVAAKKVPEIGRLTLILGGICLICALLLGLVNLITAEPIKEAKLRKSQQAMEAVLPASSYDPVAYTGGDPLVAAVYLAGDQGYVVEVKPSGFGGELDLMVGIGNDGAVTGISVISHAETSGLGAKSKTDAAWGRQYAGKSGTDVLVTKDGGQINAITGATITSRAVSSGVTAALNAIRTLG
ncbi:RnfABCDGE type electron transport complex subunit G [Pseudoflavonifractor sp. 524-17]|uniref:RnfABCDGE type electron transport complex subunit G n=1 Tax=Pseudoflavonifractor sp. 524-17 TaxID=2304577 RepID=UPI00137ACC04|nr:RnfABCDGE type electron transport complex subunit G [Pseudoflavonifractor sp. 524-17]NCE65968.1 RnfABCDGE type electron transport complex subunit G [Pseudoflavonifractor sp. 524-17]